ncbi:glycosyltransferase family 2 protein [Microbulbifer harenosus]|uniref:Glycosyltransferase family 2 protein n=1 Tax=Microbulbifer harenosus TaxID=2576840 RepID=A0ABY2UN60_9GAMM|nr:glycosyltransferase family 2 protein [Microbulbifer harenosus]TLM80009.1 glycosyltransferase family 2 protein [Microbulbifer harenosus]
MSKYPLGRNQYITGVAAILKNEADYVLEWLAYHSLIGFGPFFIADNVSDDGTSQLLEALDSLGIISRVFFPRKGDQGPQSAAYTHILRTHGHEVDLLAFIDADEFIVCPNGQSLPDNLRWFYETSDAGALALNWRCFGSSGEVFTKAKPVIERFTRCSEVHHDFNRHIKSLVKPSMVQRMLVHHCELKDGRYYGPDGQLSDFEDSRISAPRTVKVVGDGLRVNHYVVKSRQEHFLKKFSKGSVAGSAGRKKGEVYFKGHDRNECLDDTLLPYVADVKKGIDALKTRLATETPLWAFGSLHLSVKGSVIQGWAKSEFTGALKVRLLINGDEFIVDVDQERPDVVRAGVSDRLLCGFRFRHVRAFTENDEVQASIYGCFMPAVVHKVGSVN